MKTLRVTAPWRTPMPLAYAAFTAYLILAILHSRERMLNSDCGYQLFHIINSHTFFFQEARYGMFITQLPVVLGVLLHLPMKALVLLYSIGLAGSYGACILVAHRVFRSSAAALAIMLALVVGVGDSFCHATTETHMLLALSGLLSAALEWLGTTARRWQHYTCVSVIALWCLFTHPNALFTIGFASVLAALSGRIRVIEAIGLLCLCGLYFGLRLLFLPIGSYDGRLYADLMEWNTYLGRFWQLYPIWFIQQYLKNEYLSVLMLLAILIRFQRNGLAMLFTLASTCFFWVLTVLVFHEGNGESMMEKSFMPGIFMLCLPFAALCIDHRHRKVFTAVALLLFVHAFINIELHSHYYSRRMDTLTQLLKEHGRATPKIMVLPEELRGTDLQFSEWGTSVDAMMLSRCLSDSASTIFLLNDTGEARYALSDPDAFLFTHWALDPPAPLDPFYFDLPHVTYREIHIQLPPRIGRFSDL